MGETPTTPDHPPDHVMEILPVTRGEWEDTTDGERVEVVNQTVERFAQALQPVADTIRDEVIPAVNEAARTLGDAFVLEQKRKPNRK